MKCIIYSIRIFRNNNFIGSAYRYGPALPGQYINVALPINNLAQSVEHAIESIKLEFLVKEDSR